MTSRWIAARMNSQGAIGLLQNRRGGVCAAILDWEWPSVPEIFGVTEFFVEALDDIRKLIFGTDFPWGNGHFRVAAVVYARVSEDAKRKILGENGAEFFKLDVAELCSASTAMPPG